MGQPWPFSLLKISSNIGKKTVKRMIFLTIVFMVLNAIEAIVLITLYVLRLQKIALHHQKRSKQ
ncbi:hypothetical protein AS194_10965 [Psychrobacter piscatorii]|uniref:Uncharacterized protein n=1 Tax=Psychrobacter piscatorii TaxID=554343 RepID=A0A0T6DPB2_9GAMM|nr:hypothetical protein AS194_10965 [Psychrobacter piscatorii]